MGVSCLAGLFWRTVLGNQVWLAALLAVAFSIIRMQFSSTLHRETLLCILKLSMVVKLNTSTCMSVRLRCTPHDAALVLSHIATAQKSLQEQAGMASLLQLHLSCVSEQLLQSEEHKDQ